MEDPWQTLKHSSTGPVLIWPDIRTVVNIVFQEILALTKLQHIITSKEVTVQKKCSN